MEQCPKCGCTPRCDVCGNMLVMDCYYCGWSDSVDISDTLCDNEVVQLMQGEDDE